VRIAIGSDHAGVGHKGRIVAWLRERGHHVTDFGTHSTEPVDYPVFIRPVAEAVARGEFDRGIVLGGSGNGEAIVANRVSGVRCTLCWTEESARLARAHNDANVLALGERLVPIDDALRILGVWLATPFDGGRHARRIQLIDASEGESRDPQLADGRGASRVALRKRDLVERASEESFPASDPPPWSPLLPGAPGEHPDGPHAL
jgi:ribose 5-phosphate isomerase B